MKDKSDRFNEGKKCIKCGQIQPIEEFVKDSHYKNGRKNSCKSCLRDYYNSVKHIQNPKKVEKYKRLVESLSKEERDLMLKKKRDYYIVNKDKLNAQAKEYHKKNYFKMIYGISNEEYNHMKILQDNKCAICGTIDKLLLVDHNHTTLNIRGLLCNNCNIMIGHAKDNINILESAIKYLKNEK